MNSQHRSIFKVIPGIAALLIFNSCASVSVDEHKKEFTSQKPDTIYVMPFETATAEFNVDRKGSDLKIFKTELQKNLQSELVKEIGENIGPAAPCDANANLNSQKGWLVRGVFVRVNQGSRLLRTAVGFGAGGTKLETRVYIHDLSTNSAAPFLTFNTTGGSGAEPGIITGVPSTPVEVAAQAAGGAGGIAHGVTEDTERTAREITAELSDYMYRRGWIPEDKRLEPKKLTKN